MSETTPETAAATEPVEATETPETATEATPKPTETVDFWKAKAREQERRAKDNAEAAKRLAEIEDAQKTEAQRLADRQAQIERERDEAKAEGLRYKAAIKYGVAEDYFDLLGSGDEEAIAGRAERIGGLLKLATENEQLKAELAALKESKAAPTTSRPVQSLAPGATPTEVPNMTEHDYPSHWFPKARGGSPSGT